MECKKYKIIFLNLEGRKAATEMSFCKSIRTLINQNDKINDNFVKIEILSGFHQDIEIFKEKLESIESGENKEKVNILFVIIVDIDKKTKSANQIILNNKEEHIKNINFVFAKFQKHIIELIKKNNDIEDNFYYPLTDMKKEEFENIYKKHKSNDRLLLDILNDLKIDIDKSDVFQKIQNRISKKSCYSALLYKIIKIINE